jgi:hypothetical protein
MARRYSASFSAVAVTAIQDLFSLVVAANEPVRILACYLSQHTDVGDSEEEMLRVQIIRGYGTVGSGGSAPSVYNLDVKGTGNSATCRANDDTPSSAGTPQIMHCEAFNIRSGWVYIPTPETQIRVDNADDIVVVKLIAAPGDSVTMNGTLYWEEG